MCEYGFRAYLQLQSIIASTGSCISLSLSLSLSLQISISSSLLSSSSWNGISVQSQSRSLFPSFSDFSPLCCICVCVFISDMKLNYSSSLPSTWISLQWHWHWHRLAQQCVAALVAGSATVPPPTALQEMIISLRLVGLWGGIAGDSKGVTLQADSHESKTEGQGIEWLNLVFSCTIALRRSSFQFKLHRTATEYLVHEKTTRFALGWQVSWHAGMTVMTGMKHSSIANVVLIILSGQLAVCHSMCPGLGP